MGRTNWTCDLCNGSMNRFSSKGDYHISCLEGMKTERPVEHPLTHEERNFDVRTAANGGYAIQVYDTGFPQRTLIAATLDEVVVLLKDYFNKPATKRR